MGLKKTIVLANAAWLIGATSTFAWDPMEGAEDYSKPASKQYFKPSATSIAKPLNIQALRAPAPTYSAPVATTPVAAAPAIQYATISTPAPVYTAAAAVPAYTPPPVYTPAPAIAAAPVYVPPLPEPTYTATPIAQTAAVSSYSDRPVDTTLYGNTNRFSLGVEGFYDRYKEKDLNLDSRSVYGSLTASWTHYFNPRWFGALEARGSAVREDYKSPSGRLDDVPQQEYEGRILVGYDVDYLRGRRFKPYIGIGTRYYEDESKGEITNLGFYGYDRRITHLYIPIGFAYEFPAYGLQFTPKIEIDPVFWGSVSSRLGNVPGYENIRNYQNSGMGVRGEFLVGQTNTQGYGWQAGPYFRLWNFKDSETHTDSMGNVWIEPKNTRLQTGVALKFLF